MSVLCSYGKISYPLQSTFRYNSPHWTSQASYGSIENGYELKTPGYWLRNFTKICVTFGAEPDKTILVNYTAESLYSALHQGIKMTWPIGSSHIATPSGIDKSCLVPGLNMQGPPSWEIMSRVGLESISSPNCSLPYLVRGVGFHSEISCGDMIISKNNNPPPQYSLQTSPSLCRIYIQ